jgi:hypothetical protein
MAKSRNKTNTIHHNYKGLDKVIKQARKEGWRIEQRHGGHIRWLHPDGKTILFSPSTANKRSWANFLAMLKKSGFDF